ncbi:MAG: zinc-dependent metalloprotease [Gordonia sp. (in: high G+C Gram-positive bacteria)]|uniref:zinc-dependent metalloprotease n=1 Tax=Gordonia sp. (in: high G+C Gram-positive bacteria) TaxID=84139 RepID=UPI0039E6CA6B
MADDEKDRPTANIDWALASSLGRRLARPGPKVTRYTMEQARTELADAAVRAEGPVRDVTRLADGLPVPAARVLDRSGWIEAAAASMPAMLDGRAGDEGSGEKGGTGIAGKLAGTQAAGLLAFLSGAILGQYDPFSPDPQTGEPGVLMLVAPNIIGVERQIRAVPSDFRLWVCLHEVTHRVQFSANPWLSGYMQDNVELLTGGEGEPMTEMLSRITETLRSGKPRENGILGLMQLVQTPEQADAFDRMLALGTLLEGHADHVMDAVGPAYVPTVESIRASFEQRRNRPQNPIQRLIRALIGMDAKMAQYVRGKAFVDAVVGQVGMDAFNTIWTGPHTMPTTAEIAEPDAWIQRVL